MQGLYTILTALAGPFLKFWTAARIRRGKDVADRHAERYGVASVRRPPGPVIWVHAASLGETRAVLPVAAHILDVTDATVLFTTATVTAARLIDATPGNRVVHQFAPLDRRSWVTAFLDHWRPDLALRVETEIWPHAFQELKARDIPLVMVNGKMKPGTAARWRLSGDLARRTFAAISLALVQQERDASALRRLGVSSVRVTGDLKSNAAPLPADEKTLSLLKDMIAERPVWIAASTHGGEDPLVIDAHHQIKKRLPNVLTLIVPRHPDRGPLIMKEAEDAELAAKLRSTGGLPGPETEIYVADTIGELGLFYRLAQAAFVGKSLTGEGGQNPSEPARLGVPVIFGPHMENFEPAAAALMSAGGARQVDDVDALAGAVIHWLTSDDDRRKAAAAASRAVENTSTALQETCARLSVYLEAVDHRYGSETP